MEAHQLPQNVTSFQFKLVGDMTLKQFLFLAAGVSSSYIFFIVLVPISPILGWPLVIVPALFGAAFAFLPIADRPLDYWLGAFLKAIYSPTKRVWIKKGKKYNEDPFFFRRLTLYSQALAENQQGPKPTIVLSSQPPPQTTSSPPANQPTAPSQPTPPQKEELPTEGELQETVDLARQAQTLQAKIIEQEKKLDQIRAISQTSTVDPLSYTNQVNSILENLKKLMTEASVVKNQLSEVTSKDIQPPAQPQLIKVEVVRPDKPKISQPVLTSFPNVINGVVTDSDRNFLEGVVIVISNKDGLPVRALKTNKLGQFTGSTPLPNGTYLVELEKDSLVFDVLQIELGGSVLAPLQIAAKKLVGSS